MNQFREEVIQKIIKIIMKESRHGHSGKTHYILTLIFVGILLITLAHFTPKLIENFNQNTKVVVAGDTNNIFTVKRVVDGDTIELESGERVRYLNIDTPESVKPNTPPRCFSKEAFVRNEQLLGDKKIRLVFDRQKNDKYGRILAFVFNANETNLDISNSINAKLVKEGYAKAYYLSPNTTYKNLFIKLQNNAERNKAGVWGACKRPFEE